MVDDVLMPIFEKVRVGFFSICLAVTLYASHFWGAIVNCCACRFAAPGQAHDVDSSYVACVPRFRHPFVVFPTPIPLRVHAFPFLRYSGIEGLRTDTLFRLLSGGLCEGVFDWLVLSPLLFS